MRYRDAGEDLLDVFGLVGEEVGHDEGEKRDEFHQVVLQWRSRQHQPPVSLSHKKHHHNISMESIQTPET